MQPYHTLSAIDESNRPDHFYLEPGDRCFYMGEYVAKRGYTGSPTNNLISNFKKSPDVRGKPEWKIQGVRDPGDSPKHQELHGRMRAVPVRAYPAVEGQGSPILR